MKKVSRPQSARIRRILELIRSGTRTGKYPNARDFGAELGVSRPTVMRDLDFLRDDERAPIEYVASRHGYRLSDETWQLRPIELSRREVFSFAVARKLVAAYKGTPLESDMESVLEKIAASLEGSITIAPSALTDHVRVVADDHVVVDPHLWTLMAEAMDAQEQIRMWYQKFDGTRAEYVFEPYHLVAYHGNWYAIGRHVGRGRLATFAVSRVESITSAGVRYEMPESFNIDDHMMKGFGIIRGEKSFKVRLLFSPNVAAYIRERVWHPSQELIERRDGSVEIGLESGGWQEIVRWVLSWQPDCRVLSPQRLRARVAEKLSGGLQAQAKG